MLFILFLMYNVHQIAGLYKEFHIHMVDNAKKTTSEMNNPETSNNEMDYMSDDSDDPNQIDYYEVIVYWKMNLKKECL